MLRAGLLSDGQVAQAQAHSVDRRIPLVESILELGLADEDAVCTFFHSKLTIPRVTESVLERLEPAPLQRVPAEVAWRHSILPVSIDDVGNVTVAMADPTDMRAVDAITEHTGGTMIRAVAALGPLREALARYYGPQPAAPIDPEATQPAMSIAEVNDDEPAPAEPPPSQEGANGAPASGEPGAARSDWNPPLLGSAAEPTPLSSEAFGRLLPRLVAASDRDEVMRATMDFLAAGFERVILFTHLKGELRGRDARGRDLNVDAVCQVRIPAVHDSVFNGVIERKAPYFGRMPQDTPVDMAFAQALGGVEGNVLVLPVLLADKVPLLVFASGTSYPVDPRSLRELTDAASHALQRLIVERRSRGA